GGSVLAVAGCFFKQSTAYGMATCLEFGRVLFRSRALVISPLLAAIPGPAAIVTGAASIGHITRARSGERDRMSPTRSDISTAARSEERRVGKECSPG